MTGAADAPPQKTAAQITQEWQAIETKRPGGRIPNMDRVLATPGVNLTPNEQDLLEMLGAVYRSNQEYHQEMGVLIAERHAHAGTLDPLPEGAAASTLDLLAGRPTRPVLDWSAAPPGRCASCDVHGPLSAGQCGACHDAALTAEWTRYAARLETALKAQADADARLRAENAALRGKLDRVRSVHVYMAETTARRVPESFFDALAHLEQALNEPLYDPQTGALLPLPDAWTPEETETLRVWAALLAPDSESSVSLTRGRDADTVLSLAEMLAPDPSRGRIAPELSGLVQVSVADLLLFRQAFLTALNAGGKG